MTGRLLRLTSGVGGGTSRLPGPRAVANGLGRLLLRERPGQVLVKQHVKVLGLLQGADLQIRQP